MRVILLLVLCLGLASINLTASTATVVRPAANMYSRPAEDADVVSQAIYGANVELLEEVANWAKVRTKDNYSGWMPMLDLIKSDRPYAEDLHAAQVASLFANLYQEPSITRHRPVVTIPYEARLEVVRDETIRNDHWFQVRLPDDRSAWVQAGDLTFDFKNMPVPQIVEFSKRFLGLPYLWGGTSTFGYDCSGFTQMLCRRRGVVLPRDAGPQAAWSGVVEVDRADLQPGDLLFFGETPYKITHTGFYIGNGEYIHATAKEKPVIQISRLDAEHPTHFFITARRPK